MPLRAYEGRATHVLDASALIAILLNEPGQDLVSDAGRDAVVSAVNMSETIAKLIDKGSGVDTVIGALNELGFMVAPFDIPRAEQAAALRAPTRGKSISFADRACLALAIETSLPVLTADRAWSGLGLGADIRPIR